TFLQQQPALFAAVNRPPWIDVIPTARGYATMAGVELTLADCLRYLRQLGGIDHAAQILKDLASQAKPGPIVSAISHHGWKTQRSAALAICWRL
ncbi:MAG: hypothetical protein ACKO8I_16155, partial [Cyanobacteriota bacterium]